MSITKMWVTFFKQSIKALFFYLMLNRCFAEANAGLGGVARSLMDPVTVAGDFIDSGCLLVGGSFIFASIVKYIEHRRSPLMVPISTVIFLFIAGVILVALPFLSYVTSGVPYSLFK